MNPLIILGAMAGVPLLLALVLRVSSIYLFASVAAGGLLVEYLSDDVALTLNTFLKDKDPLTAVHFGLLCAPLLLTMLFLRKTLKIPKLVLEFLPLLASIAMLVVLAQTHLPDDMQRQITSTPYGRVLRQSQDVIIGAAVVLNLGLMWLLGKKRGGGDDEHHGKHKSKHH